MRSPQARWRHLRSCAGELKSITWAYRTRVAPFEPDALHPKAGDDQAEQTLRTALVEWRTRLSSGADLNNTTLRKHFPERVFKHGQRQRPKASSFWQLRYWQRLFKLPNKRLRLWCCDGGWQIANNASQVRGKQESKLSKINEHLEQPQSTAYCAPYHLLV